MSPPSCEPARARVKRTWSSRSASSATILSKLPGLIAISRSVAIRTRNLRTEELQRSFHSRFAEIHLKSDRRLEPSKPFQIPAYYGISPNPARNVGLNVGTEQLPHLKSRSFSTAYGRLWQPPALLACDQLRTLGS